MTFDNVAQLQLPLTNTLTLAAAADVARNLNMASRAIRRIPAAPTTLRRQPKWLHQYQHRRRPQRGRRRVWPPAHPGGVAVGGGSADRRLCGMPLSLAPGGVVNQFCPPSTWVAPFCHDASATSRHTVLNPTVWAAQDPGHWAPYNPQNSYNAGSPYANSRLR